MVDEHEAYLLKDPDRKAEYISGLREYVAENIFDKLKFLTNVGTMKQICKAAARSGKVKLKDDVSPKAFAEEYYKHTKKKVDDVRGAAYSSIKCKYERKSSFVMRMCKQALP